MHPELFTIGNFTIHSYGFLIMLGALLGYTYLSRAAKKELNISPDKIQTLAIMVVFAAFVGGKLFFYFEKPSFYFNPPSNMLVNFRTGFVFYGSLLFAIPLAVWFFWKEKWPVWGMMDRLAITTTIVHAFGRMGCFAAGCCYGVPTDSAISVTFTDPDSQAQPLHTALHPTQLYSVALISFIFGVLMLFKRHKRFEGQLFFIYIMLYAVGRGIIEIFRGDLRRGFIIEDVLSHSQLISLILVLVVGFLYYYFNKKNQFKKASS